MGIEAILFGAIVAATLVITWWAARHTVSRSDFYAADSRISPLQNGLAIAGDYMSASTILGITALFYSGGQDGFVYLAGSLVGWPIVMFLVGERLRNLGRFTFADVCVARMTEGPTRLFAAASTVIVSLLYLIAQLVGAGALIEILFGVRFDIAVTLIGALMCIYVLFGGMLAATWVQVVKASLLMVGGTVFAFLVLGRFNFSLDALVAAAVTAHPRGTAILEPGGLVKSASEAISFGIGAALGPAGMPHLLMRFFTVPDARAARHSVAYATVFMSFFYVLVAIFGFGCIALLTRDARFAAPDGGLIGGANMATLHLARAVGGPVLFGFMAAVIFSTILAVVSGLCVTTAATVAHDVYGRFLKKGAVDERTELWVARITVISFGVLSILLALAFRRQMITYMVVLAFSIAASVNAPILLAAMYLRRLSTRTALCAGWVGLFLSVILLILGPTVWVGILGHAEPIYPTQYPAIAVLPVTAAILWIGSLTADRAEPTRSRNDELRTIAAEIGPPRPRSKGS